MSLRERFNLSILAIQHPWLTVCFWLAVTVAGLLAYGSLKYALFPDVTFPVVIVNAKAPLETILETEAQLTAPIESALQSLEKLDNYSSSTYPGQAAVTLSFSPGTELQALTERTEAALEEAFLPRGATVEVIPYNLNESSAASYAITSDRSLEEITEIARNQILPAISEIPGVLRVDLLGDAAMVRSTPNEVTQPGDFPTFVRFNGQNALAFQVIKQEDANTLEVVSRVEQRVQQLQDNLPDLELTLAQTQADYIHEATQATVDALIGAIVLAVAIIFLFLRNFWATLITALAIPLSLLGTFIVMALFGFNLETITLLAIALAIGIIVDDAIVEVENIARHLELGQTPRQAAILATREIGLTVSATTLTIVAVFVPVALMEGTVGQFFKPFGLTVSAAVLTSLLVARTLSPVLAIYWLRGSNRSTGEDSRSPSTAHPYYRLLHWSLQHRRIVVAIAILSFVAGVALIPLIPKGFIPKLDRGEFNIVYTAPLPKLSLSRPNNLEQNSNEPETSPSDGTFAWLENLATSPTRILLRRARSVAEEIEAVVIKSPVVESVYTVVGGQGEPNKGKLFVRLKENRQASTAEAQEQLRTALPELPGVTISIEDVQFVDANSEKNLQIALIGENLEVLSRTANELRTRAEQIPGLVDITISVNSEDLERIERLNGERAVYFSANLSQDLALGDATDRVAAIAQSLLPAGVRLDLGGDSALGRSVLESFAGTITLSAICMLVVLILLFGRLLEPLVVGLCLPLAIVGAMLALLITQSDFGMISLIGLIFLLGLLDKNAILLMDYANQLRQDAGLERTEALLTSGVVRLRPILMTTASTILGMLPLAIGLGAGAELRQPMAVAIIGGLLTSSLLSLIVVPVVYTLVEDWWIRVFKRCKYQ